MAAPVAFQRIYRDHPPGPVYSIDADSVAAVVGNLAVSMKAAQEADLQPFYVVFSMSDGGRKTIRPKVRRA